MELYEYQADIVDEGLQRLQQFNLLLLSLEMRVGKTPISLSIANRFGAKSVLFVTKKKVLDGKEVEATHKALNCRFKLEVINYESLHKVQTKPDLIILDEAHRLGAFPKPCLAAKQLKGGVKSLPVIYLSGTLTPESWSQIYHILYISQHSPFRQYSNFYKWAAEFVNITYLYIGQQQIKEYKDARIDKIKPVIEPFMMTRTQEEAGFETIGYKEHIHYVECNPNIPKLIAKLQKDKLYIAKDGKEILADTPAKLMSKHHQLSGGSVITECKDYKIIDSFKAEYIRNIGIDKFAIYYIFQSELKIIFSIFGDRLTQDVEEFRKSKNKIFVAQVVSGREGLNLSSSDHLVFYNIPYSYTSWSQTIARLQSKNKTVENNIHYVFPKLPKSLEIEPKILTTVKNKEIFTSSHYKKLDRL